MKWRQDNETKTQGDSKFNVLFALLLTVNPIMSVLTVHGCGTQLWLTVCTFTLAFTPEQGKWSGLKGDPHLLH